MASETSKVDQVERAIKDAFGGDIFVGIAVCHEPTDIGGRGQTIVLTGGVLAIAARAAILALREPSESMLAAVVPYPAAASDAMAAAVAADRMMARQRWIDLIDAALAA